jgi:transposase
MAVISISPEEIELLQDMYEMTHDERLRRRTLALLKLADGLSVEDAAKTMKISPRTIYNWTQRFQANSSKPLYERLTDKPRSGRPRKVFVPTPEVVDEWIQQNKIVREERDRVMKDPRTTITYLLKENKILISNPDFHDNEPMEIQLTPTPAKKLRDLISEILFFKLNLQYDR